MTRLTLALPLVALAGCNLSPTAEITANQNGDFRVAITVEPTFTGKYGK